MRRYLMLMFVAALTMPSCAARAGLTIEEAYKAIPHERTPFDPKQSRLPGPDSKYLNDLFFVTDMALRERVTTLQKFYKKDLGALTTYNEDIDSLLESFELVQTPEHLQHVKELVVGAIRQQQKFFNDWARTFGTPEFDEIGSSYSSNELVRDSHTKLTDAYNEIKHVYPGESLYNKKAFFDHLCALDFL